MTQPRRPRRGDRVRVLVGGARIVGTVARNDRHLPNPYQIDVDLAASEGIDDPTYFETHYAGPYRADELEVLDP